jgi:pimeloyl-ACP methyl ester carboxylesterase
LSIADADPHYDNLVYGQSKPPVYNLANIKTRVRAFVGKQDKLGDVKDNRILEDRLDKYGVDSYFRYYDHCGHMTFMWGKETLAKINADILEELENVDENDVPDNVDMEAMAKKMNDIEPG